MKMFDSSDKHHTLLSFGSVFKLVLGVSRMYLRKGNRIEVDFFTFLPYLIFCQFSAHRSWTGAEAICLAHVVYLDHTVVHLDHTEANININLPYPIISARLKPLGVSLSLRTFNLPICNLANTCSCLAQEYYICFSVLSWFYFMFLSLFI